AHYAVHTPLQAPLPAITKYQQKMKRDHSQISAPYAAMVEAVDRGVGRLMATLDRLELTSNTLVIIASDNGGEMASTRNLPLRAGKGTLYEGGIRVPLILHWPGRLEAGKVRHEPVMLADLYPTILSAVSVKLPSTLLDGVNLWPALSTDKIIPQRDLYFYYPHYLTAMSHPGSALRAGSWKLIDFYDPPHLELYNLAADVSEAHDVASKHPEIAQQMKRKIDSSLQSVGTIMYTLNPNYRELKGHR